MDFCPLCKLPMDPAVAGSPRCSTNARPAEQAEVDALLGHSSPEAILRPAIERAALAICRGMTPPVTDTYAAQLVAQVMGDDLVIGVVSRHLANEIRVLFGVRRLDLDDPDGVAEETMMEALRRRQG